MPDAFPINSRAEYADKLRDLNFFIDLAYYFNPNRTGINDPNIQYQIHNLDNGNSKDTPQEPNKPLEITRLFAKLSDLKLLIEWAIESKVKTTEVLKDIFLEILESSTQYADPEQLELIHSILQKIQE